MIIRPTRSIKGEVELPGDKSISHRAALISSIADGATWIENYSASEDCASTLECLSQLGVDVRREGKHLRISGLGKTGYQRPAAPLNCGNSGTTMRLLAGVLAGQPFDSVLTGDESLSRRPMKRVIEPLAAMGTRIDSDGGRAPLRIFGRHPLDAVRYELPVASAQIKSCILLAGLNAKGNTSVVESAPTRDHTERMLRWFGVDVEENRVAANRVLTVSGSSVPKADGELRIPCDISASAFFIVAAACLPGSDIRMKNVGLNPGRAAVLDMVRELGVTVSLSGEAEHNNEPVGDISVSGGLQRQQTREISGQIVANLIDEIPILAVLGTRLEYGLEVRDADELRVKESDRIAAVVENLRRMGAEVDEFPDGFRVRRSQLTGARVDSFGDHRIAMAFAVAGLLAEGETIIDGAECAGVSFPGFFEVLANVAIYE